MLLPDYRKNPSSISCFDILLSSAVDIAPATGVLAIIPALAILHNFGHSRRFFAHRIAENATKYNFISGSTPKNLAPSFVVARSDTTSIINLEGTLGAVVTTGEATPHSCLTHVMETVGDGQSNKEWSRAGNNGRLVRNESGPSSHGTGSGNSEGGNGSGNRGAGVGVGGDNGNAGGGSAGGSDHRAPGGRRSSAAGSSKLTSTKHTGETGGAPPPPPPPHAALAVDDGCPKGFPNHQDSFELFNWTTIVVGLAVLVSLGKWILDRWRPQQIKSVDVCPRIPPTVVQILPDICFRPDLTSAYDPNSYLMSSLLPRQELFYDCGCKRVLDDVQFNISTKEAFEILNGAARPKFHQNGADIGCGKHAPTISTSALSRLDIIFPLLFSLVIYLVGYTHCLLGQCRDTPIKQYPGGTSHPGFDAQGDPNMEADNIICDIASQQTGSNAGSGSGPPLDPSAPVFIPTQRVATPINLPKFHFIPVLDTRERHRTRRVHKDDRHGHCQIDLNDGSFSGLSSSKWSSGH